MKRLILLFLLMVACCSSAFATLTVRIEYEEGQATFEFREGNNAQNFKLKNGEDILAEGSWSLTSDMDPYVESSVLLTNKTSKTQTYLMEVTTDVSPSMSSCFYSGYVSGSLIANAGGGYFSTVGSTPLYSGMIDDIGVLSLYSSLLLNTGAGTTTTIAEQSAGPLPGGEVNETISIQHKFKLGAGDTVTLNGYFEVVPEPATICLLGLGALAFLRKRKA